jgi:hypothetical protein
MHLLTVFHKTSSNYQYGRLTQPIITVLVGMSKTANYFTGGIAFKTTSAEGGSFGA